MKANKGLILALIICIIAIIGLSSYIAYDKLSNKKETTTENTKKEEIKEEETTTTEESSKYETSGQLELAEECGNKACTKSAEIKLNDKVHTITFKTDDYKEGEEYNTINYSILLDNKTIESIEYTGTVDYPIDEVSYNIVKGTDSKDYVVIQYSIFSNYLVILNDEAETIKKLDDAYSNEDLESLLCVQNSDNYKIFSIKNNTIYFYTFKELIEDKEDDDEDNYGAILEENKIELNNNKAIITKTGNTTKGTLCNIS